jgi:hypothetical protein
VHAGLGALPLAHDPERSSRRAGSASGTRAPVSCSPRPTAFPPPPPQVPRAHLCSAASQVLRDNASDGSGDGLDSNTTYRERTVDAAHVVFGTFLCCLWSFARIYVRAASGRQRFNVLGAWNAVTRELTAVTNTTVVNTNTMCELYSPMKRQVFESTVTFAPRRSVSARRPR